jgi:hypothetical protein
VSGTAVPVRKVRKGRKWYGSKKWHKDQQSVLKIVISLSSSPWASKDLSKERAGGDRSSDTFVADLFGKAGDSFVIIVGAVIFLAGLCVQASMFIKSDSRQSGHRSMIILMVIWALTIIFADFD